MRSPTRSPRPAATRSRCRAVSPTRPRARAKATLAPSGGDRPARSPRHRDVIAQTRTPAAQEAEATARLAVLPARGHLAPGEGFVHESIIGSRFEAGIAGEITVGGRPGIVPTIAGQAWITGVFQHGLDPTDPFRTG